jgi:hypothetical protein
VALVGLLLSIRTGAVHLRGPIGGRAKGIPRYADTDGAKRPRVPITGPLLVTIWGCCSGIAVVCERVRKMDTATEKIGRMLMPLKNLGKEKLRISFTIEARHGGNVIHQGLKLWPSVI